MQTPGEVEIYGHFSKHAHPCFIGGGLSLQFHYNQVPGIHFKVAVRGEEYRNAIVRGIKEGMSIRFPDFPASGSIWITKVTMDAEVSMPSVFYILARCVIEQAYAFTQLEEQELMA
jgi:hypothetical protein